MKDELSVLIITRNHSYYLDKCLRSLEEQTDKPDEVIVADTSDDNKTERLVKRAIDKTSMNIKYYHIKHVSISHSRNYSIKKSRHEILALIDSDCIADKYWCKEIKNFFRNNQEINMIAGKTDNANPVNNISKTAHYFKKDSIRKQINKNKNKNKNKQIIFAPTENMSFRKEIIKKIGYFDLNGV